MRWEFVFPTEGRKTKVYIIYLSCARNQPFDLLREVKGARNHFSTAATQLQGGLWLYPGGSG
jgi:hypothetical protein